MLIGMTDNLFVAPDVCAPMVMYRNYAWHRPFEIIGNQHPSWNVIGRGRGNVDSFEQESVTPFPAYDFGGKRFWLGIVAQILAENRSSQFLPFLQASPSRSQERQTRLVLPADPIHHLVKIGQIRCRRRGEAARYLWAGRRATGPGRRRNGPQDA